MGYIEVRCPRCREILAASDDTFKGKPLINTLIVEHYKAKHNKDIEVDKALSYVIILEKSV